MLTTNGGLVGLCWVSFRQASVERYFARGVEAEIKVRSRRDRAEITLEMERTRDGKRAFRLMPLA